MRMFTIKPGNDTDEFYAAIEVMMQGPLPKGRFRPIVVREIELPFTILSNVFSEPSPTWNWWRRQWKCIQIDT